MRAVDVIRTKRDGGRLDRPAIRAFVMGATDGSWPSYQTAVLLMAIALKGMTPDETAWLTEAMVDSGSRLDLSSERRPTVDKHSTGGVGDKTSIVLAPIVAACGAAVPMMSGRALGHTGGTLDKLEAISGFRTRLSPDELRDVVARVGCAIVGQTEDVAPADRVLYSLRDVTATVESIPLISASIMSKKLAESVSALVLDVKTGRGAFMKTDREAELLARSLVQIGLHAGVRTEALITSMEWPLGRAVGNALEIVECVETLQGCGPDDLTQLSCYLAARMLVLAGLFAEEAAARAEVDRALGSGRALERLAAMIEAQGGDPRVVDDPRGRLPAAAGREPVVASRAGVVAVMDAEAIGRTSMALGAGRDRVEDDIDPAVGVVLHVKPGDLVDDGQPIADLVYRDGSRLASARQLAARAIAIDDARPALPPLIRSRIDASSLR